MGLRNDAGSQLFIERFPSLARFSKKYGIPLVAGTDTHSSSKYKAECRNILLKAKRQSYGDEDARGLAKQALVLMMLSEIPRNSSKVMDMFAVQGALTEEEYFAAIQNTNEIAAACEDFSLDGSIKYPNVSHIGRSRPADRATSCSDSHTVLFTPADEVGHREHKPAHLQ